MYQKQNHEKQKSQKTSRLPHFFKSAFKERVLQVVRDIPKGKTLSYKEVALRAESPNAARAVGTIMKGNTDKSVPCHRVIKSDGSLGGYNRGTDKKLQILKQEGVRIKA